MLLSTSLTVWMTSTVLEVDLGRVSVDVWTYLWWMSSQNLLERLGKLQGSHLFHPVSIFFNVKS